MEEQIVDTERGLKQQVEQAQKQTFTAVQKEIESSQQEMKQKMKQEMAAMESRITQEMGELKAMMAQLLEQTK